MAEPLRRFFGINGVAHNEHASARHVAGYFEWIMFIIAVCLPFYWYFSSRNQILPVFSMLFLWFIWLTFITEFITLVLLVKNRKFYIRTNWLNLIIILFTFPLLTRQLPIFSIFWLARGLVLLRVLFSWWDRQKNILAKNHLAYTLIAFGSICLIGGALVSLFDSGIGDPISGIWWAVQTITTVGYGDIVPVTLLGRAFAVIIMVMGVALITILTANFSAYLLGKQEREFEEEQRAMLNNMVSQLESISKRLGNLEKKINKLGK